MVRRKPFELGNRSVLASGFLWCVFGIPAAAAFYRLDVIL